MKIKKIVLVVLALIFVVALTACNNNIEISGEENLENLVQNNSGNIENENIVQNSGEFNEETEEGKLFYFVGSELIAIGENGFIRPIEDENGKLLEGITYDELFSEEYFTAYSLKEGTNNKIDKVKLAVFYEDYLGSDDKIVASLMKLGKKVSESTAYLGEQKYDIYEINLPMQIPDEISDMDAYNQIGDNGYGNMLELSKLSKFVTNAKFDINFETKVEDIELSPNAEKVIYKYIEDNKLSNGLKYSCTGKFITDLENDNSIEKIYVVETQNFDVSIETTNVVEPIKLVKIRDNADIARTGAFSLILVERENEEIEIIFESNIKPFDYTLDENGNEIDFWDNIYGHICSPEVFIADIDNDKDKEIIVDAYGFEPEGGGLMQFYTLNNGKYSEVATSYYGFGN